MLESGLDLAFNLVAAEERNGITIGLELFAIAGHHLGDK